MVTLPIDRVMPEIKKALEQNPRLVIKAPPGAGKTTRVPLALLDQSWLGRNKILLLEPRRIAARAAAARMARMLGEPLGKTVGYHISMDRVVSPETRIEVVTEGILTRRIQNDPGLSGTGLVIFDEFHERNLNSDLGLALCLEAMEALCEELKIIVMSATLDTAPLAELLDHAPVVESTGKSYPVETRYLDSRRGHGNESPERLCAGVVTRALAGEDGDVLVFLPGAGEIRRVAALLNDGRLSPEVFVVPLYGNLTRAEQDLAIRPSVPGRRKVVLATSIAETSLTIDGVTIVVDSGLMREPRFSPGTGMGSLMTVAAPKSSTDQRRGRAGRTGPGVCYRLWSAGSHNQRRDQIRPEIFNTDLSGFTLELALWGVRDPEALKWLDPPPKGSMDQARELLTRINALDSQGGITAHGKSLAGLGLHPRLAHMLVRGRAMGLGALACTLAALLQEPDFLIFRNGTGDADLRFRLELLSSNGSRGNTVKKGIMSRIRKLARRFRKQLGIKDEKIDSRNAGTLLALAYPERIALNRGTRDGRFLLASGRGGFLPETDPLAWEELVVAAHVDGRHSNARIFLAAPYPREALERDFARQISTSDQVAWDCRSRSVAASRKRCYHALVLDDEKLTNPDPGQVCAAMVRGIREEGLTVLPWTRPLRQFQARAVFLGRALGEGQFPDLSDAALAETLETWLAPFLDTVSSLSRLKKIDLKAAVLSQLTYKEQQLLDRQAPSHLTVPSGSRIPLDYGSFERTIFESPVLAVRLQEMFGCDATPRVANGRVPVTLHLLSPASRPVQVTQDLESFWDNTYLEVKKDLKGRYPKHYWPEDPRSAVPTRRVRPKSSPPKKG
ncbi:MAG: ATP-dependent helicase HrpB [Desulfobacteraceae bacterium]|nr:ATP-dependent helicase HrpB [Desulfobacteraceae bacterium]